MRLCEGSFSEGLISQLLALRILRGSCRLLFSHCLVGLVVKASVWRAEDPGYDSCLCNGDFSGSSHTSDLNIETPVATLPGFWRSRVSDETGWTGVSIL